MGWDGVVVGAGHNGLVAANLLADAGWSVLVLEASAAPGGGTRTAELAAPGFRSELCSAFYPLTAASPVIAALGLDRYGLRWRHTASPCGARAARRPDGHAVPRPGRDRGLGGAVRGRRRRALAGRVRRLEADEGRAAGLAAGSVPAGAVRDRAGPPARAGRQLLRFARFAVRQSTRAYGRGAVPRRGRPCCSPATRCTPTSPWTRPAAAVIGWLLSMLGSGRRLPGGRGRRASRSRRAGVPAGRSAAARSAAGPGDRGRGRR